MVDDLRTEVAAVDDLTVAVDPSTTVTERAEIVRSAAPRSIDLAPRITAEAVKG